MGIDGKESEPVADLQRHLADALRENLLHGCTSIRDPRWPDRTAPALAAVLQAEFDILPKGELQQEWGVQITEDGKTVIETHPGLGDPLTRDVAFYENERWKSFGYNTEGVMSRQVSRWKREDQ